MTKEEKKDASNQYPLILSLIVIAIIGFMLPMEYKFKFTNEISLFLLMISSVYFSFSISKTVSMNKTMFDNFGASIFCFIYFIFSLSY